MHAAEKHVEARKHGHLIKLVFELSEQLCWQSSSYSPRSPQRSDHASADYEQPRREAVRLNHI